MFAQHNVNHRILRQSMVATSIPFFSLGFITLRNRIHTKKWRRRRETAEETHNNNRNTILFCDRKKRYFVVAIIIIPYMWTCCWTNKMSWEFPSKHCMTNTHSNKLEMEETRENRTERRWCWWRCVCVWCVSMRTKATYSISKASKNT